MGRTLQPCISIRNFLPRIHSIGELPAKGLGTGTNSAGRVGQPNIGEHERQTSIETREIHEGTEQPSPATSPGKPKGAEFHQQKGGGRHDPAPLILPDIPDRCGLPKGGPFSFPDTPHRGYAIT
jgi:hypothetical protein